MGRSFLLALAVAASLALPALAADRQQGDFPTGTRTYAASPAGTANPEGTESNSVTPAQPAYS